MNLNMKRYSYILAALLVGFSFTSCVEELGTEPGNDKLPAVIVYSYSPSSEYDSDTDQRVRFVSNGKVSKAAYLVEKQADKKAFIDAQGEAAYAEKVLSQGTAISFASDGVAETTVTGMTGDYEITAAASDGSQSTMRSVKFSGIPWDPNYVIPGTYVLGRASIQNVLGATSFPATLQRHETDETLFRIKGAFGTGSKVTIRLIQQKGEDDDGVYTFFRIPEQAPTFSYGSYGTVSVRDVGYWQGDDAYVTDNGYESGMYADGTCFLCIQYYVSAGSLGYTYDYFIPD